MEYLLYMATEQFGCLGILNYVRNVPPGCLHHYYTPFWFHILFSLHSSFPFRLPYHFTPFYLYHIYFTTLRNPHSQSFLLYYRLRVSLTYTLLILADYLPISVALYLQQVCFVLYKYQLFLLYYRLRHCIYNRLWAP